MSPASVVPASGREAHSFRLAAVVCHAGASTDCGHYFTYARREGGGWDMFNDARVHRVKLSTVLSAQAFILAYEAAPPDALEGEEEGLDGDEDDEDDGEGRAQGAQLYGTLALVGALVAAIAALAVRKVALV